MFNFIKNINTTPIIKTINIPNKKLNSLKKLFQKTIKKYKQHSNTLTQLTNKTKKLNNNSTINFLHNLKKKQQHNNLLLQTILNKIHNTKLTNIYPIQTNQHILNIISHQLH